MTVFDIVKHNVDLVLVIVALYAACAWIVFKQINDGMADEFDDVRPVDVGDIHRWRELDEASRRRDETIGSDVVTAAERIYGYRQNL